MEEVKIAQSGNSGGVCASTETALSPAEIVGILALILVFSLVAIYNRCRKIWKGKYEEKYVNLKSGLIYRKRL